MDSLTVATPTKTEALARRYGAEALKESLRQLFGGFHGLVDVRVIESRGLAFVEFASEAAATPALQALHNFRMSAVTTLNVSYAR